MNSDGGHRLTLALVPRVRDPLASAISDVIRERVQRRPRVQMQAHADYCESAAILDMR